MSLALKLITGVSNSILQAFKGGLVSEQIAVQRLEHCLSCKHFQLIQQRCLICGCFMSTKVRIALAECPDKPPRWSAHTDEHPA